MVIKVFIPERNNLNERVLFAHPDIERVENPQEADFIIAQSTFGHLSHIDKTIYIAVEPPRTSHRIWCYDLFDRFHTVICHNPDPSKENQFPFTPDDSCQYYPTYGDPYPFHTREDTTIKTKAVFYAGMINIFENSPDAHGGINITPLRKLLGDYFKREFPGSIIIGIGWGGQRTKVDNWREDKQNQIMDSNVDFVLALENTMYPNYLYEKIWDGFACDKVTMYLGDPRVEHHIPTDCFIDLRPYFDTKSKKFDLDALGKYLKEMTQEEYDRILNNARKFRETCHGKYVEYMDKLTNFLIRRMLNGEKEFKP